MNDGILGNARATGGNPARPLATAAQALAGTDAGSVINPAAMHLARRGSGRSRFWELFADFTMNFSGNNNGSDGCAWGAQSANGGGFNLFSAFSESYSMPTSGILQVTTGTNSAGRGGFDSWESRPHALTTGITQYETLVNVPVLATATDDFVMRIGYCRGSGIDQQIIGFEYDRSANTNWQGVTGSLGNFTRIDTGVPVTADAWVRLGWVATSAAVNFFINDRQVGTSTSNIRTASHWIGAHIIKTAGTTARTFLCDYIYARHDFTNPRTWS